MDSIIFPFILYTTKKLERSAYFTHFNIAGDHRVNVIPSLGGNHLVFVREHNRIVEELRKVRPDWDAATLFQETRKIIGALLQQINYREFLPSILREEDLVKYNLKLQLTGHSSSYNSSRNPAAKNVFNAAAFRFGHSQVVMLSFLNTCEIFMLLFFFPFTDEIACFETRKMNPI